MCQYVAVFIVILAITLAYLSRLPIIAHQSPESLADGCPFFVDGEVVSFESMVLEEYPNHVPYVSTHTGQSVIMDGMDSKKTPVVLLHGFPDTVLTFQALNRALVQQGNEQRSLPVYDKLNAYIYIAGYRTIMPNLWGYEKNTTLHVSKQHFSLDGVAHHLIQLLDELRVKSVHVIGHDWGSVIAQRLAVKYPHRVTSLTVMAVPTDMLYGFLMVPSQLYYSWYMLFFQLPYFPEQWLLNYEGVSYLWGK